MTHDSTPDGDDRAAPDGDAELMDVVVSVDDAHMPTMTDVVSALESAGMMIESTMPVLGTVTGRVPPARLADIGLVEGVAAIEQSRRFQLPPPDSDVQ
jgi:hypothetical protein